jgi:hypothetical protein
MLQDLLSAGADVLRELQASSCDPEHPVQHVRVDEGYWLTTGSFPQEITVVFKRTANIGEIRVVSRGVRQLQLYNEQDRLLGEENWTSSTGDVLEKQKHTCSVKKSEQTCKCVRIRIFGFDDFASVVRVQVMGECVQAEQVPTSPIISPRKSSMNAQTSRVIPALQLKPTTDMDFKADDNLAEATPMEQKKSALAGNWDDKPLFGRKGKAGGVKTKFKVYTPRSRSQVQGFAQGKNKS